MRFASTFFALATAALVAAQPSPRQVKTLNPPRSAIVPTLAEEIAHASLQPRTNAKRFAAGLPPMTPRSLLRHRKRHAPHGGSKVITARDAVTSPLPDDEIKCNIRMTRADNEQSLGYIMPTWNDFGEYGQTGDSRSDALEVTFPKGSTSEIDFWATNSPSDKYPYFGSTTAWAGDDDNIGDGSTNFAYIAGTQQTPKGSPAAEAGDSFSDSTVFDKNVQSAIWKYNEDTQEITAQWVNMDSSRPATYLFFSNDENHFLGLTGDIPKLNKDFEINVFEVKLHCVSPMRAA